MHITEDDELMMLVCNETAESPAAWNISPVKQRFSPVSSQDLED